MTRDQQPETRDEAPVEPTQPDRSKHARHNTARNSALRILTRRDHSRYELLLKLKKRGFSDENIDDAVAYCERLNYIDDERTAQVYIRQLKRKGYGKRRIQLELKKKGSKTIRPRLYWINRFLNPMRGKVRKV